MTAVAVQSAAQRLRGRFRELIRSEIAATLDEPTDDNIDDEIHALFAILGRGRPREKIAGGRDGSPSLLPR